MKIKNYRIRTVRKAGEKWMMVLTHNLTDTNKPDEIRLMDTSSNHSDSKTTGPALMAEQVVLSVIVSPSLMLNVTPRGRVNPVPTAGLLRVMLRSVPEHPEETEHEQQP